MLLRWSTLKPAEEYLLDCPASSPTPGKNTPSAHRGPAAEKGPSTSKLLFRTPCRCWRSNSLPSHSQLVAALYPTRARPRCCVHRTNQGRVRQIACSEDARSSGFVLCCHPDAEGRRLFEGFRPS